MVQVSLHAHQTRICVDCEILWAVGTYTRAAGPENYRCDDCGGRTEIYEGTHLVVIL